MWTTFSYSLIIGKIKGNLTEKRQKLIITKNQSESPFKRTTTFIYDGTTKKLRRSGSRHCSYSATGAGKLREQAAFDIQCSRRDLHHDHYSNQVHFQGQRRTRSCQDQRSGASSSSRAGRRGPKCHHSYTLAAGLTIITGHL